MCNREEMVAHLTKRLGELNQLQLAEVERLLARFETAPGGTRALRESGDKSPHSKTWPHAPLHRLAGKGTYIMTARTLNKTLFFRDARSLDFLERELPAKAEEYRWQLKA